MLTVGGLFSGVGGIELGLQRAGMQIKWMVEKDEFCRRVLDKHWSGVPKYEDVKDVGKRNLETVDLVCGGVPCQPVSKAGRQKAQSDPRWLWPEFARVVSELRPRYVLVENVPGLLHRGMGDILIDLAACGYDAEWNCVPASAFGAPHCRNRLFIVAYPNGQGVAGCIRWSESELFKADDVSPLPLWSRWPHDIPKPFISRGDDGFSARVDRLRALGNAVVPQVAEWIGRRIVEAMEKRE